MKVTTTTVPVVTTVTEQQKRFVLELTPAEAHDLLRVCNHNRTVADYVLARQGGGGPERVSSTLGDIYSSLYKAGLKREF